MKCFRLSAILLVAIFMTGSIFAQRVGFISSDQIRELFPEAKQADQRLATVVEEWKREIKEMDVLIEAKEFEIKKNRLVWTEDEKKLYNGELESLKSTRMDYAKNKYSVGGEYDQIVKAIIKPVEEKIFAAVQKVASEEGYDMVWDKSTQPLPYVNFKFDLTVKVLSELGVDTEQLEKDLQDKIAKDPRNQEKKSTDGPTKKTRKRRTDSKEIEKEDSKLNPNESGSPDIKNPEQKNSEKSEEKKEVPLEQPKK